MNAIQDFFEQLTDNDEFALGLRVLVAVVIAVLAAAFVPRVLPVRRFHPQHQLIVRRVIRYAIVLMGMAWALRELGFSMEVLLGTAGLMTVAIGFAAQTSASNLISGLFLMGEQPFRIGDVIRVDTLIGEVVSIDLMSARIKTYDNLLIRIPNETLLKANVTNVTHYPIRRLDMKINVAFTEKISRVREVLLQVADNNHVCMVDPEPLIICLGFGPYCVELQFSVWATHKNYVHLRNQMHEEVKEAFDAHDIRIPYPHQALVSGRGHETIPVRIDPTAAEQAHADLATTRATSNAASSESETSTATAQGAGEQ